jgi:CubicO group peptidase (beta-lactamase class C family)
LWLITGSAFGQDPEPIIPDSPAGEFLSAFLTAFNSGEPQAWREFIQQHANPTDSAERFGPRFELFEFLHGDLGGMEIYRIDSAADYRIATVAKAVAPQGMFDWVSLTISVDSLPPHYWGLVGVRPADDPTERLPEGKLTDEQIVGLVEVYLDELVAQDRFSGAVLFAKDRKPLFKKAYGLASKRYGIPNKTDTKFNLGSMNKMFTGVAIAQLAQQGKLVFDDPIIRHLPDYANRKVAEKVTIHHLLTHTSGMDAYWDAMFKMDWTKLRTVADFAGLFVDDTLLFKPGEKFHYSNSGPIVLGLIIEAITGMDYHDYVRENIYKPAGMINTDCYHMDRPVPNLAIGYTKTDHDDRRTDEWHNNLFMHSARGGPAGGGFSTVEDLLNFDIALRNFQLLDDEHINLITTGKEEMGGPDMMYGYLFGVKTENGQRIIGHSGGAPGISAILDMYFDSGYTVAVMGNYDGTASMVARKIRTLLMRE